MRLDFNILWIEDQQGNVESTKESLERKLKKEGFRLQVEFASSVDEAMGYLSKDVHCDHIDLILIDYNLRLEKKGDVGLKEIRNKLRYKEIIFYSARSNLQEILKNSGVEGVYTARRSTLVDRVEGVFTTLIKKVVDIEHSRGIVMGATSDIDNLINECLVLIFEDSDENTRRKILQIVQKKIKKIIKNRDKDIEKISRIEHVKELLLYHFIFSSSHRTELLKSIITELEKDSSILDNLTKYNQKISPMRNKLGHITVKTEGFSRKIFLDDGKELTSEDMRLLRIELLDLQDTLKTYLKGLKITQ